MEENREIKLKINDNELRGVYANQVAILHSPHEFVLDFIAMFPPEALVNSRVITNPAALKQMYLAIGQNLQKYEEQFGEIILDEGGAGGRTPNPSGKVN